MKGVQREAWVQSALPVGPGEGGEGGEEGERRGRGEGWGEGVRGRRRGDRRGGGVTHEVLTPHSPDPLLMVGQDDPKHATPVGKDVEEVVPHLLREQAEPVVALGQGVDDVGDEGGKGQSHLLHFPVILSFQVAPGLPQTRKIRDLGQDNRSSQTLPLYNIQ